ncbi:MAG: ATP-binding protein [Deferribacteres bacterium]|nr:ATP-binding protein [candidate division KSB1 bacterium]MCB9500635.1 ATP-binding protein [Deferribacteres bacterium]
MEHDNIKNNAAAIDAELQWFYRVLDTRLKLHFGHDCEVNDIVAIKPPQIIADESMYGSFIAHYNFSFEERLVFVLSLVPHIRPQSLDVFFTQNAEMARQFTEFGGTNHTDGPAFLPTGETALFLIAGSDLFRRIRAQHLFQMDHVFARHNILKLERSPVKEPEFSGHLQLSQEIIDLVTTGHIRKPMFSSDFPARYIETALEWDDLVLEHSTMEQVLEIKAWIEYGDVLLGELELAKKIKPGFRSLFYGPSGTGKTLTATLLGKMTELDVYRIDLSMVVSKYIGETEKNLEKIFEQAEHKNWILFFDEADALFGKRTEINDAHDRFANQEVSYLLQRIEDYAGVVILATNMKSNLDEGFTRRFQSIIHFPMPKAQHRERLWQNGFSPKMPLAPDVDLHSFAEKFELSGGAIMNVVRYATLMALKNQEKHISRQCIVNGLHKEMKKEGRTVQL